MREILFRGKPIMSKTEWVEGFYNCIPCGRFLCADHCIQTIDYDGRIGLLYTVYENTVGQFTGLTDKNGKKIFEGDILKFHKFNGEPEWIGFVRYDISMFVIEGEQPVDRGGFEVQLCSIDRKRCEIVGNIHDNQELMEDV